MNKTIILAVAASVALLCACNLSNKTDNQATNGGDNTEQTSGDNSTPDDSQTAQAPIPDNAAAQRVIRKYNEGPAVNNDDYNKALDYLEAHFDLTKKPLAEYKNADQDNDANLIESATDQLAQIDSRYPYKDELLSILYQASEISETQNGLVPMNEDVRARFKALQDSYSNL